MSVGISVTEPCGEQDVAEGDEKEWVEEETNLEGAGLNKVKVKCGFSLCILSPRWNPFKQFSQLSCLKASFFSNIFKQKFSFPLKTCEY